MSSQENCISAQDILEDIYKHRGYRPVEFIRCSYSWTINNFSLCKQKVGERLESPQFSDEHNEVNWRLYLYPYGFSKKGRKFIYLELALCTSNTKPVFAKCEVILFNSNLKELRKCESVVSIFVLDGTRTVVDFVERTRLLNAIDGLLPDDEIIVFVVVSAAVCAHYACLPERPLGDKVEPVLYQGLASLLRKEKYSDITLNVEWQKFRVHKVILASMSYFFFELFGYNEFTDTMQIHDFTAETIVAMLNYMYTGEIPRLNMNTAARLLEASDKYEIHSLKTCCVEYLSTNLTAETVADVLCLAGNHDLEELEKKCLDFVCVHAKENWHTSSWESFTTRTPLVLLDAFKAMALSRHDDLEKELFKKKKDLEPVVIYTPITTNSIHHWF